MKKLLIVLASVGGVCVIALFVASFFLGSIVTRGVNAYAPKLTGTKVSLSYRSEAFSRVKQKNRELVQRAESARKLKVILSSNVEQIGEGSVTLDQGGKKIELKNDAVIVCAGGILPTPFLKEIGVQVDTKYGTA